MTTDSTHYGSYKTVVPFDPPTQNTIIKLIRITNSHRLKLLIILQLLPPMLKETVIAFLYQESTIHVARKVFMTKVYTQTWNPLNVSLHAAATLGQFKQSI